MSARHFQPNQIVVHPNHGLGSVNGLAEIDVDGTTSRFLVVEFARTSLTVRIPEHLLERCGLRGVCSREEMQAALAVLEDEPTVRKGNWSRWAALYLEKLNSGRPALLAEVLRDTHDGGVTWKTRLRDEALQRMAEELALVENIGRTEAEALIRARFENGAGAAE